MSIGSVGIIRLTIVGKICFAPCLIASPNAFVLLSPVCNIVGTHSIVAASRKSSAAYSATYHISDNANAHSICRECVSR